MRDDLKWEHLDRYFSGDTDSDVAPRPAASPLLESVRVIWQESGVSSERFDTDAFWARLRARMDEPVHAARAGAIDMSASVSRGAPVLALRLPVRERLRGLRHAVAAAIVLAATGVLWRTARDDAGVTPTPAPRAYVTSRGERATFSLGDGTKVTLNVASRLQVPRDFGLRTRTVRVDGEAYFEVQHHAAHPFVVLAEDLIAEDLGTAFSVRAYPGDAHPRVIVREGIVSIAGAGRARKATPLGVGQAGYVAPDGIPVVQPADTATAFAWIGGRLAFVNVPLRDVVPELERWYDLDIHLADDLLASRLLTASLQDESTDEMLQVLAASLDVNIVRRGRTITLRALPAHP